MSNPLAEGLPVRRRPDPCVIVIFGASGDLTRRKLFPALYALAYRRLLPEQFAIVGTYDEFPRKVKQRCAGVFSTMLLDLPPGLREDDARVREILRELRAP